MTLTVERVQELLAALPGNACNEIHQNWPCVGQVSLMYWDKSADDLPADFHHFNGFDYKILHDEGEADMPVWDLITVAPDLAAAYLLLHKRLEAAEARTRDAHKELARVLDVAKAAGVEIPGWKHASP